MAQLATEAGGKARYRHAFTRTTQPQGLTQGAVAQAFTLAKGGAGSAETADGKSRIVFKVTEITPAPPPTKDAAQSASPRRSARQDEGETLATTCGAAEAPRRHINETELQAARSAPTGNKRVDATFPP